MRTLRKLVWLTSRFRGAEAGVAAVEFALLLPMMLVLYVGMVEASALISTDRKVQLVSGAVGDLVARSNGQITSTELGDFVKVASGIMTPYSATPLDQVISQVKVSADGSTAIVEWSKHYVHQSVQSTGAHAKGSAYTLPAEIRSIALDQYVIVAESRYAYQPSFRIVFDLVGVTFANSVGLYRQNFYLPRFGTQIKLDP